MGELGIVKEGESTEDQGDQQELKGKKGDLDVTIQVRRESPTTAKVEVTARKNLAEWDKDYAKDVSFTPLPVSPASRRATPNNVPRAHSPRTRKPAQQQTAPTRATAAPRTTPSTQRMPRLATLPPAPRRPLQRAPAPTPPSSPPTSTRRRGEIQRKSGSWSRSAGRARRLVVPEVRGARRGGRRGTRRRRHLGSSIR